MTRTPILNDPIRAYLRRAERTALLYDMVQDLIKAFGLTAEQAGRVIVEWINETAPDPPRARRPEQQTALNLD